MSSLRGFTRVSNKELFQKVEKYYTNTADSYGATARGVDWNGEESQILRFEVLTRITDLKESEFSANDLGCGYGSLLEYFQGHGYLCDYLGIDISPSMVSLAESRHLNSTSSIFLLDSKLNRVADYTFASGIINVMLDVGEQEWLDYIFETLSVMNKYSTKGFSFNCLSSIVESKHRRDYLYYAEADKIRKHCLDNFSKDVSLLTEYGLFEFTVHVRKTK
jgi:SAM-dependent methyltransferase